MEMVSFRHGSTIINPSIHQSIITSINHQSTIKPIHYHWIGSYKWPIVKLMDGTINQPFDQSISQFMSLAPALCAKINRSSTFYNSQIWKSSKELAPCNKFKEEVTHSKSHFWLREWEGWGKRLYMCQPLPELIAGGQLLWAFSDLTTV